MIMKWAVEQTLADHDHGKNKSVDDKKKGDFVDLEKESLGDGCMKYIIYELEAIGSWQCETPLPREYAGPDWPPRGVTKARVRLTLLLNNSGVELQEVRFRLVS